MPFGFHLPCKWFRRHKVLRYSLTSLNKKIFFNGLEDMTFFCLKLTHNLKVVSSNPTPPTNFNSSPFNVITAELTPNMFARLCSWTYNLWTGALQRSSLRRLYINEGRYQEAADEMLRWVFCNGKRLRGLVLRRTDERALFLA